MLGGVGLCSGLVDPWGCRHVETSVSRHDRVVVHLHESRVLVFETRYTRRAVSFVSHHKIERQVGGCLNISNDLDRLVRREHHRHRVLGKLS